MTFEELIENLGLDEPEIIQYNSGADLGGLTEEQRNYIMSEFINGRPIYVWSHDDNQSADVIDTNVFLQVGDDLVSLTAPISNLIIVLQSSQEEQTSES